MGAQYDGGARETDRQLDSRSAGRIVVPACTTAESKHSRTGNERPNNDDDRPFPVALSLSYDIAWYTIHVHTESY